jgi:hypothetical protein
METSMTFRFVRGCIALACLFVLTFGSPARAEQ